MFDPSHINAQNINDAFNRGMEFYTDESLSVADRLAGAFQWFHACALKEHSEALLKLNEIYQTHLKTDPGSLSEWYTFIGKLACKNNKTARKIVISLEDQNHDGLIKGIINYYKGRVYENKIKKCYTKTIRNEYCPEEETIFYQYVKQFRPQEAEEKRGKKRTLDEITANTSNNKKDDEAEVEVISDSSVFDRSQIPPIILEYARQSIEEVFNIGMGTYNDEKIDKKQRTKDAFPWILVSAQQRHSEAMCKAYEIITSDDEFRSDQDLLLEAYKFIGRAACSGSPEAIKVLMTLKGAGHPKSIKGIINYFKRKLLENKVIECYKKVFQSGYNPDESTQFYAMIELLSRESLIRQSLSGEMNSTTTTTTTSSYSFPSEEKNPTQVTPNVSQVGEFIPPSINEKTEVSIAETLESIEEQGFNFWKKYEETKDIEALDRATQFFSRGWLDYQDYMCLSYWGCTLLESQIEEFRQEGIEKLEQAGKVYFQNLPILGKIYEEGINVPKNLEKAKEWYWRAVEKGQRLVPSTPLFEEICRDYEKRNKELRNAQKNNPAILPVDNFLDKTTAEARFAWSKSEKTEKPVVETSENIKGGTHWLNYLETKDLNELEKAIQFFSQGWQCHQDFNCLRRWGFALLENDEIEVRQYGLELVENAAAQRYPEDWPKIGQLYDEGKKVSVNKAKARECYQKGIEKGYISGSPTELAKQIYRDYQDKNSK